MRLRALVAGLVAILGAPLTAETVAIVNAQIFDGNGFAPGTLYVEGDRLVEAPTGSVSRSVDLEGRYIVPAFGEAHHHTVMCNPKRIATFMEQGIFYAQIMNAARSFGDCVSRMHGTPESPDLAISWAGLTATGAHPTQIGERFLPAGQVEGNWTFSVDSAANLVAKWPAIRAQNPLPLKIFLNHSEDFAALREDRSIDSFHQGLDPELVPEIVRRAHADGIRVAAHILTAHDFEVALRAGVDEIAHLPGFVIGPLTPDEASHPWLAALVDRPQRFELTAALAEETAKRGVRVIATALFLEEDEKGAVLAEFPEGLRTFAQRKLAAEEAVALHNLSVLHAAGVELLLGSDRGEGTSVDLALELAQRGVLSNVEILRSLCMTTPRAIFSERRVGCLDNGCEASFLVLEGDPLPDLGAIRKIVRRMKGGVFLESSKPD